MVCSGNSWDTLWFEAVFNNQDVVGYFKGRCQVRYWINSLTDVEGKPYLHYMEVVPIYDQ